MVPFFRSKREEMHLGLLRSQRSGLCGHSVAGVSSAEGPECSSLKLAVGFMRFPAGSDLGVSDLSSKSCTSQSTKQGEIQQPPKDGLKPIASS